MLNNYHYSWNDFITENIKKELIEIEQKIGNEYFPNKENVLRFMNLDLSKIKCIIVGMEPYPSFTIKNNIVVPEATGRSFEINSLKNSTWSDKFKQSSLRNILKTIYYNETNEKESLDIIRKKIETNEFIIKQPGEWFDSLEKQGVMFLNATLTVKPGMVDTHTQIWNKFMNSLLLYIYEKNPNITWFLWGKKAEERVLNVIPNAKCIITQHPRLDGFILENCFKEIKDINWTGII